MSGAAAALDDRKLMYKRLGRRNRLVGLLRIGVPVIGLIVLAGLLYQIILSNLVPDVGVEGLRIEREKLVVDAPSYSGIMADGTRYTIVAEAASTPLNGGDIIAIDKARLNLVRQDDYKVDITANEASFALSAQTVEVAGQSDIVDSNGLRATLTNTLIEWQDQRVTARDNVVAHFADGSVLTGSKLVYSADRNLWVFDNVKLTLSGGL